MEIVRVKHNTPEWLAMRRKGIGASDAGAVFGISPSRTNVDVWEEKVGKVTHDNLANDPLVQFGKKAESHIVKLFALDHPELKVKQNKNVVYWNGFMFASLDGELETTDGKKGILEIKTNQIYSWAEVKEWDDRVPQHYYTQVLHQLVVTGWDFVIVKARLRRVFADGRPLEIICKEVRFNREECLEDMSILVNKERKFWDCVERRVRPPLILPTI